MLAGCQAINEYYDQHFLEAKDGPPRRMPARQAMEPALREIPLGKVTVEKPQAPPPAPPRTASLLPPRPPAVRNPVVPAPKPAAPKQDVPTIAPGELVGSDFNSVLQVLRKPDMVQSSALFVVWTYSQAACTLQLFFYPDIQTKIFRLLKYDLKSDAGEKTADRSACLHDMMAVKNDEPAIP
jgi:hypothetical protein